MVDNKPVKPKLADDVAKLVKIDRLLDVAVYTELIAFNHVALFLGGGHDDDGDGFGARVVFESAEDFEAIYLGQLQIEQDNSGRAVEGAAVVRAAAKKKIEGFFTVARDLDFIGQIPFLKSMEGEFDVVWIILHQQDFNFLVIHGLGLLTFSRRE